LQSPGNGVTGGLEMAASCVTSSYSLVHANATVVFGSSAVRQQVSLTPCFQVINDTRGHRFTKISNHEFTRLPPPRPDATLHLHTLTDIRVRVLSGLIYIPGADECPVNGFIAQVSKERSLPTLITDFHSRISQWLFSGFIFSIFTPSLPTEASSRSPCLHHPGNLMNASPSTPITLSRHSREGADRTRLTPGASGPCFPSPNALRMRLSTPFSISAS
jgi:hypothetical protein